jgi:acetyl-CoA carboxylase carboxyltransferase component
LKPLVAERAAAPPKEPRRLEPRERLELLCDPRSFQAIRSTVGSRPPARRSRPGDGVVGGAGTVGGRPVYCYAQDRSFAGGSLGAAHADTIVRVLRPATRGGVAMSGFM